MANEVTAISLRAGERLTAEQLVRGDTRIVTLMSNETLLALLVTKDGVYSKALVDAINGAGGGPVYRDEPPAIARAR
ncbi:hypothetical protein OSH08_05650 [Kaistia geumhonensis]|uniref:Large exoprotein involved in heme utilization and adhesion n=1 Tax=Kaistia geumhonensis TaxID=410839 RepID=A0ABU0M5R4_9HYPH|nr:hypothetical protein [Kaistia geumhonensis]MCX5478478.1 hypothetical protein [Kaistia geumhonensis]MDQ0516304.1 large exoprotein involved in heme utilization and adhesion [Kaistia geumhonensis]